MTSPLFSMTYRDLPDVLFADGAVDVAPAPKLLFANENVAKQLGIDLDWLRNGPALDLFSGRLLLENPTPLSMAYSGHQFGHLSPQLGDGRAVLLGEVLGEQGKRFDLHLKGSGQTAYSRRGDGKSTLRAVLKEFLYSECLTSLGIPSTSSLAVLTTGETVMRDGPHPGAILVRTASSHLRVGTFQFAALTREAETVAALADYAIGREYPSINLTGNARYQTFLEGVVERQARLIAAWMSHGFIHGVMNTDNMTISGETIDFGPCAFLDGFHADGVYSSIDHYGRYAWNKQPEIAVWNLTRLAESILPLLANDEDEAVKIAEKALGAFNKSFVQAFHNHMMTKMGLSMLGDEASEFINQTFALLHNTHADFTLFFRRLSNLMRGEKEALFFDLFDDKALLVDWLNEWRRHLKKEVKPQSEIAVHMDSINPIYIPRNHNVEEALAAARTGDLSMFKRLLSAIQNPYNEDSEFAKFAASLPDSSEPFPTFCET